MTWLRCLLKPLAVAKTGKTPSKVIDYRRLVAVLIEAAKEPQAHIKNVATAALVVALPCSLLAQNSRL